MRGSLLALLLLLLGCPDETGDTPTDDDDVTADDDDAVDDDDSTPDDDDSTPDDDDTIPDDDDSVSPSVSPFVSLTGGGAHVESPQHKLDLFVAPQSPVGTSESATHRLHLGPAAMRK